MAQPDLLPYKQDGMVDRYVRLFGEKGFLVFGKHQFDTFDFTERFADKLILTSAIARYALYDMRFPGPQPEGVADDILDDRHPFNLLFSSDGTQLLQVPHDRTVRATSGKKFAQELQEGDIRAFGSLSDGIPTAGAMALIESMRSTLEEL